MQTLLWCNEKYIRHSRSIQAALTGNKGRIDIFELLIMNIMDKDATLNKRSSKEIRQISIETSGLLTLLGIGRCRQSRRRKVMMRPREKQSTGLKRSGSMQTGIVWKIRGEKTGTALVIVN